MGVYPEGVCKEQDSGGEIGQHLLSGSLEQDGWDGEHNNARVEARDESFPGKRQRRSLSIPGWELSSMRRSGKPSRLEIHRLKYNQAGRRGPLLRMAELTDAEKKLISSEVLQDVRVKRLDFTGDMDEQIFDEVQFAVLSEWGIMCPHGLTEKGHHALYVRCITCGAMMKTPQPDVSSRSAMW